MVELLFFSDKKEHKGDIISCGYSYQASFPLGFNLVATLFIGKY